MKPGKAALEVRAAEKKNVPTGNNPGMRTSSKRVGTNRGTVSGSNPKFSPHVGTKGGR